MIELNVTFQENYKQLDALCKDIFSSKDGVTEYINTMEKISNSRYCRSVYDWDIVYKQLKHMRWIRNQLAHEVGAFDSDLCTKTDIEWLKTFYNSILNTRDPLAKVRQAMLSEKENQQQQIKCNKVATTYTQEKPRITVWERIKSKIKKWFS